MEYNEQQNWHYHEPQAGNHEDLERDHQSQKISGKYTDTQAGKETHHLGLHFRLCEHLQTNWIEIMPPGNFSDDRLVFPKQTLDRYGL